jgi:hypothetical protein
VIKVFSISLMLLFFCSNLNADTNIEKALEKCADDYFINKTEINEFSRMLYLLNPEYQKLENESKPLKEKMRSISGQFDIEYKEWEKDNPKPVLGVYGETNVEKWEKKINFLIFLNKINGINPKRINSGNIQKL